MHKTYALFGLAGLLVGGALLVEWWSGFPSTPPPPAAAQVTRPTPPTSAPTPLASTSVSLGELVKLEADLSNGYVLSQDDGQLFLRMRLAAERAADTTRPPLAIAIVIDRSGSMDGDKMEKTRDAARRLIDRLGDHDQLAIISYATDYEVNLPLSAIGRVGHARIHRILENLYVGGGTNLSAGLGAAIDEVARARGHQLVRRIVLMSDGNANQGETDPAYLARVAERARDRGTTVTTLGVGVDFNEDLMTVLAENGGGTYYYAKDGRAVISALERELGGLMKTAARGVTVALDLPAGVRIAQLYGYSTEVSHGRVVIPVGDLAAGEQRQIVARLVVSPGAREFLHIGPVGLSYQPVASDSTKTFEGSLLVVATDDRELVERGARASVVETAESVVAAASRRAAAHSFAQGRQGEARRALQMQIDRTRLMAAELNSRSLVEQTRELEAALRDVTTLEANSSAGKDLVKREKHRAHSLAKFY